MLGSLVLHRELEYIGLENMPQYNLYKDETQNEQTFLLIEEELEHMLEVGDHEVGRDILLPRGDQMTIDHVAAQS